MMESGKIDNQLLLALEMPEEERARTDNMNTGFLPAKDSWELVVRYSGETEAALAAGATDAVRLLNGYAVLTVPQDRIGELAALPEIEYIEKPKKLFYEAESGLAASCFLPLQRENAFPQGGLTGAGVIVAIIDSGIDYAHPDFRNADGTTRLIGFWDMTLKGKVPPPEGYRNGSYYTEEAINLALLEDYGDQKEGAYSSRRIAERQRLLPSVDTSGHGTGVAGIACGNGRASEGRYRGGAYQSSILAVKLGGITTEARTTLLMEAVNFCLETAMYLRRPIAVNLSYGNNYGAHNGASLVERYLESAADVWKSSIVIGSGNEGSAAHHASGNFRKTGNTAAQNSSVRGAAGALIAEPPHRVEWVVASGEQQMSLQFWSSYLDDIAVTLIAPSGNSYGPLNLLPGTKTTMIDRVELYCYVGDAKPYDSAREIYFEFLPAREEPEIESGIWSLKLAPLSIRNGRYDLWLPAAPAVGNEVRFLRPDAKTTLTIPSTTNAGITVGAYNTADDSVAFFSGRGFLPDSCTVKPELAAPGVNLYTTAVGGGYTRRTGTSFAAPFVTAAAALLMEWGIVRGNDPYLYGEKLKAYLIKGAKQLPGMESPNPMTGWGALCVKDSLPI